MELINRAVQKEILEAAGSTYPDPAPFDLMREIAPGNVLKVNAKYLEEHGFLQVMWRNTGDPDVPFGPTKIKAAGIDFLADDGGITAIKGTLTVRLHEDSIRALLIQQITESAEDDTVKGKLIEQLKNLPSQAVAQLAEKAIDAGVKAMPNAAHWVQSVLTGWQ